MAINWNVKDVIKDGGGRNCLIITVTAGNIGPVDIEVNHIDPTDTEFKSNMQFYLRGYIQGIRAVKRAEKIGFKNLTAPEKAALIAQPVDDAEPAQ